MYKNKKGVKKMKKTTHLSKRVDFTFFEKLKFKFSDRFRNEVNTIISEYDYYQDVYIRNKRFFEELKVYSDFLLGGQLLKECLKKLQEEMNKEPQQLKKYEEKTETLKKLLQFYNIWNCERHRKYKITNTIRMSLKIQHSFMEGAKYVILIKVSKDTSMDIIEEQLNTFKEEKGIIYGNKIFSKNDKIEIPSVDGIVLASANSCSHKEISEIVLNDFSYFPTVRVFSI